VCGREGDDSISTADSGQRADIGCVSLTEEQCKANLDDPAGKVGRKNL